MEIPAERKPSQVMAWLGFGISLALFLMIWGVNALMFSLIGNKEALVFTTLLMLFIPVGGFLGLMGLTFSIIGLVQATKNYLRKWPSVWGIIFCCLSVISVLSPVIIAATLKNKTLQIEQPEQEEATWTDSKIELFITDDNTIKCYDNRYGEDDNPDVISLNSIVLPVFRQGVKLQLFSEQREKRRRPSPPLCPDLDKSRFLFLSTAKLVLFSLPSKFLCD